MFFPKSAMRLFGVLIVTAAYVSMYCALAQPRPNQKQTFCRRDRCLTCVGKYCTTTCRGEDCDDCPSGGCCNGTNCNICRGSRCCKSPECNTCVHACLEDCEEQVSCHHDCFQRCLPDQADEETSLQKIIFNTVHKVSYLPVNVTTVINITNTIKNENVVHNPVFVNTTNHNNHTAHRAIFRPKSHVIINDNLVVADSPKNFSINTKVLVSAAKRNCCEVIHPEQCLTGGNTCIVGRHNECSNICKARHIHLIETESTDSSCIVIGVRPYYYCGKYLAENCDACYDCGSSNKEVCIKSPNCSSRCRASIKPEDEYNMYYEKSLQ